MPRIKRIATSETFEEIRRDSANMGEKNDCAVKAMVVVTGLPYEECHRLLQAAGRRNGRGTFTTHSIDALKMAGFKVRQMSYAEMDKIIRSYPGVHGRVLKNITTHHPRRFRDSWRNMPPALMFQRGHVSGFRDGELHDWAVNSAKRVISIYIVEPGDAE